MDKVTFNNVSVFYTDKRKNEFQVVRDVTFSIKENKINTIIGPSGSGKTTLLNCISGKLVWDGEILYNGQDIEKTPVDKRNIAYVNQSFVLYPTLNVYDNIALPLKSKGIDHDTMDQMIKEICDKLDILFLLTRKPKYLSIGQQQRVAIARALVKKPDLIMFDEPLSNLDKENGDKVRDIIKNYIKENKMSVIYVTHDIYDALKISDFIYVMDEGRMIGEFTPATLMTSKNEKVQQLLVDLKTNENA